MAKSKKTKSSAKPGVKVRDLKSKKNPMGGIHFKYRDSALKIKESALGTFSLANKIK